MRMIWQEICDTIPYLDSVRGVTRSFDGISDIKSAVGPWQGLEVALSKFADVADAVHPVVFVAYVNLIFVDGNPVDGCSTKYCHVAHGSTDAAAYVESPNSRFHA